jgi:hypothetical protein
LIATNTTFKADLSVKKPLSTKATLIVAIQMPSRLRAMPKSQLPPIYGYSSDRIKNLSSQGDRYFF